MSAYPVSRHPHQRGLLDIGFLASGSQPTHLVWRRQRFPLRMTVPMYLDDNDRAMAFVIVQNPTGGVFAGDHLELNVDAASGARVHLRTQSATKLYAMDGGWAEQTMRLGVAAGTYLEYLPDPVIPQTGANFTQRVVATVETGGVLFTAETISAGRIARGERFAFERIRFETEVEVDGCKACIDVIDLEPARHSPGLPALYGEYHQLSSVLCVCPGHDVPDLAARIDQRLAILVGDRGAAGVLPGGVGVMARVLSATAIDARAAVYAVWQIARLMLAGTAIPRRVA